MAEKVKNYIRKIRYLRHPYLIYRAILRPFEQRESKKNRSRISEYERNYESFEKGVEILTNVTEPNVVTLKKELDDSIFLRHIDSCIKQLKGTGGPISFESGLLLYVLIRRLDPKIVVETGVANGISSAFILKALNANANGGLYSIDLHYREGVIVPLGKSLGWVIPEELRPRWTLMLGESTRILPKMLDGLQSIDIFIHDSRHTYKNMINEYNIVWPYLKDGGILLSDDVIDNNAFLEFADKVKLPLVVIDRLGAIRKDLKDSLKTFKDSINIV
ncbi:MAG: class I SAM-dependent methyltransferase [Nitrososphaeria archaeon]